MRTLVLALAVVLLASPVWADVIIILDEIEPGKVEISYDATSETELIRAFALDITAIDGNIIDINDYAIGDDNGGFGIFPGTFADAGVQVDAGTGQVVSWDVAGYSPVAPADDPDALGAIPGPGITIEMGSLYDTQAPAKTGVLCVVTVDENATQLCVEGNAIRGNVVLETAAEATMTPAQVCIDIDGGGGICLAANDPQVADYEAYTAEGKEPLCWCEPYQCDGDADGLTETFFKYRVFGADLAAVVENWKRKIDHAELDPCADFDHKSETFFKYRVFGADLAIVVKNWKKKDGDLDGNCPDAPTAD